MDKLIDKLHISLIGAARIDAPSLRNLPANLSKPAAFEVFMFCKCFKTVSSVVGFNTKLVYRCFHSDNIAYLTAASNDLDFNEIYSNLVGTIIEKNKCC